MYHVNGFDYLMSETRFPVTGLKIANKVWMVDDPAHWLGISEHARDFSGHVLCAGLGLGLIVHALNANPKVTRITVVERERGVIDLIKPLLPKGKRLQVLHGDFWDPEFLVGMVENMPKPDGLFYDLFVGSGVKLYPQAVAVWIRLNEMFPDTTRRIFGFPNKDLEKLDALIERRL